MIDDVINWFKQAYDNLITWIDVITTDIVEMVKDVFLLVLDGILSAMGTLIASIPVPDFISNGLNPLFSGLDPAVLYFMSQSGFVPAVGLLGAGFGFRMLRKVFTLFQW